VDEKTLHDFRCMNRVCVHCRDYKCVGCVQVSQRFTGTDVDNVKDLLFVRYRVCELECVKWMFKEAPSFQNTRYKAVQNYFKTHLFGKLYHGRCKLYCYSSRSYPSLGKCWLSLV
jgi:hypothetical protein